MRCCNVFSLQNLTENKMQRQKEQVFCKASTVWDGQKKYIKAGWRKEGGRGGGRGMDGVDGGDERCVVEGDSIRGVKANRIEQGGHRCAACALHRQAATQTALSTERAYQRAVSPAGLSLTGLLHPPGSTARVKRKTNLCCEVLHIDDDTLQHRELKEPFSLIAEMFAPKYYLHVLYYLVP